jgi:hypothetical protein
VLGKDIAAHHVREQPVHTSVRTAFRPGYPTIGSTGG